MQTLVALLTVAALTATPTPQAQTPPDIDNMIQTKLVELDNGVQPAACEQESAQGVIALDGIVGDTGELVLVTTVDGQPTVALFGEVDGQQVPVFIHNPLETVQQGELASFQYDPNYTPQITTFGNNGDLAEKFGNSGDLQFPAESNAQSEDANATPVATKSAPVLGESAVANANGAAAQTNSDVGVSCVTVNPTTVACSYIWGNHIRYIVYQLVNGKWTVVFDSGWINVPIGGKPLNQAQ